MFRRRRLIWQLFPPLVILVLGALLATGWFAARGMRSFFMDQTRDDLRHQANLLEERFAPLLTPPDPGAIDRRCKEQGKLTPARITIILPDGTVAGDSEYAPGDMENHAGRQEIQRALQGRTGSSVRYSDTLHKTMLYVALPMRQENRITGVIRMALAASALDRQLRSLQWRLILEGLVVALLASLICLVISRRISRPLEHMRQSAARFAQGDLTHRVLPPAILELADLADAMNRMAREIEQRIQTIIRQRNETEAVLSSMVEGVLAIDPEERVMHMNQAAARLLDQDADKVQGRSIEAVARNSELHAIVRKTLQSGLDSEGDVVLYTRGTQVLNSRCTSLRDAGGEPIGALLVINDVTRLRRLENMRRDFAANVSHEIKTPLTAIQGFVETLHQGAVDDPEEAKRFLGIIHKHVIRLSAVIDDLMKLSRLEQDEEGQRLNLETVRIRDVIATAVQLCSDKADQKQIGIAVDCDPTLTARLQIDLMEQAVVNLLDNAIKYSPAESRVQVTVIRQDERVRIDFGDRGIGIPKQHLARLFERFYRVDTARSRSMGGTGLGLAIVKHIVQAHGGSVSVESVWGQGSTFSIILPPIPEKSATSIR